MHGRTGYCVKKKKTTHTHTVERKHKFMLATGQTHKTNDDKPRQIIKTFIASNKYVK